MTEALVRSALESRILAWAVGSSLPVIVENDRRHAPDELHLRTYLLPATTQSLDLAGRHRGYRGLFQVSIFAPVGVGPGVAERLVTGLDLLLPNALRLTVNGLVVVLTSPLSAAPAQPEPGWYVVPTRVGYAADVVLS